MREYGSFKKWIEHEFLLPYLKIGGNFKDFWELTPYDLNIIFEGYKMRMEDESERMLQNAWLIGAYVKNALATTPVVMGYSKHSLPKYPDIPHIKKENNTESEWNEERIKLERQRAWDFFANIGKKR